MNDFERQAWLLIFPHLNLKNWVTMQLTNKTFHEMCHHDEVLFPMIQSLENKSDVYFTRVTTIEALIQQVENDFVNRCVCFNPFKTGTPPYLFWCWKRDLIDIEDNDPETFFRRDGLFKNATSILQYVISGIISELLYKRNLLCSKDVLENSDLLINKYRIQLMGEINEQINFNRENAWSVVRGVNKSLLQQKCFQSNCRKYIKSLQSGV